MIEKKRIAYLFARELDGEITPLERDELERSILAVPELRREREGWRRVSESMAVESPRIEVARMTSRVLASRGPRIAVRARWSWALAASAAFAIGGFAIARRAAPPPAPVRIAQPAVPDVDRFFGEDNEDRAALVEIRF